MKASEHLRGGEGLGFRFWRQSWSCLVFCVLGGTVSVVGAGDGLVPAGSDWKYFDQGSVPGAGWQALDFSDATWGVGLAPLGYGNSDESTQVGFGANASAKFITTYFRRQFFVLDASIYGALDLGLVRDDGAVVYLNGAEVFRSNLPAGALDYATLASSSVGGTAETAFNQTQISASYLLNGWNSLAVEVHQVNATSTDLRFDLQLEGLRRPITMALQAPTDHGVAGQDSVPLQVQVTDPEDESMTVSFFGREALPPGPDFTIIALPDTQCYSGSKNGGTPAMYVAQIDWIVRERQKRNIVFVTQLGDCVESGDKNGDDTEWRQATNALYRLEDPLTTGLQGGIPYGVAVGNHDISGVTTAAPTTRFYNQNFGMSHFIGRNYYGGYCQTNNNNHYELFSAGGLDFIILHLEYDTTPNPLVLGWAKIILRTYPNHRAIVVSHYLIETGEPGAFGGQGQAIYDTLKDCPNLFLMLCGHNPGEGRRADTWQRRTVHTLLSDYQSRTNGGNGWLRILEFSPSNHVIRVKTYSPLSDQYETDANSEFVLEYDLREYRRPFTEIASLTGVRSGSTAEALWEGVVHGTTYEWFVQVSDGSETVASPIWQFSVPVASGGGTEELAGSGTLNQARTGQDFIELRIALDWVTGNVRLSWSSVPGRVYRVVYKDNLAAPDWTDLTGDLVAEANVLTWATPATAEINHRFYRVRWIP
jgi:hypothetical protein